MASFVAPASIGGVADPRLGQEADAIGTGRHGSVAAAMAPGGPAERARRGSAIYMDSSIPFEDYHYWAIRSREVEKGLDTSDAGIAGWSKLILGRGVHQGTSPEVAPSEDEKKNEKTANTTDIQDVSANTESRYEITESEWDNAQRATRTATWGELLITDVPMK